MRFPASSGARETRESWDNFNDSQREHVDSVMLQVEQKIRTMLKLRPNNEAINESLWGKVNLHDHFSSLEHDFLFHLGVYFLC